MNTRPWTTCLIAAVASAAIWALTPLLTSQREPWDVDGSFYIVGLLIVGIVAGAIAPKPLWAHYAGCFAGQLGYELILLRVGPLVIIGAVLLLFYCAVYTGAAALAGIARERIVKRIARSS